LSATQHYIQVKLEKFEYCERVHLFQYFNLKGKTNILYRLITSKVRYFKPLFVIIWLTAYENPKLELEISHFACNESI